MSTGRSEDEAWRSIVDNYGDRAELDEPGTEPQPEPQPVSAVATPDPASTDEWDDEPEERFVPPVPPRAPRLPLPRRLAWCAVLGSPLVLVVALLVSFAIPQLVGYGLVTAFVGGFAYLVATMERAASRDPWDDGAQL